MQPMLVVSSASPGLLYVNGRMAGVVEEERPVTLPVAAFGAVYLELRPFEEGLLPMARRFALSNGQPVSASLEKGGGVYLVGWPGGVLEVELVPARLPAQLPEEALQLSHGSLQMRLTQGGQPELSVYGAGRLLCAARLPAGASAPEVRELPGLAGRKRLYLEGALSAGGRYACMLAGDEREMEVALQLSGRELTLMEDGAVRALTDLNDLVGHARLETWQEGPEGYLLSAAEVMWSPGRPSWPATPEDTALACLQAGLMGLTQEIAGYLVPRLAQEAPQVAQLAAAFQDCMPLRYALPGGEPAVGLMQLVCPCYGRVQPLAYRALPLGGPQGPWRLERLEFVGEQAKVTIG